MAPFGFFKKKKENEFDQNKTYTIAEVVKLMKEQGYSPDEIKKQLSTEIHSRIMDGLQVELKPRDISEYKKKTKLPKPKGVYTEQWSEVSGYDKKAYEYAKKVYENKFGKIINSPLSDIIKNLNEIYFTSIDYFYFPDGVPDTEDYCLTIENYLTNMGKQHLTSDDFWKEWYSDKGKYIPKNLISLDEQKEFCSNYTDDLHCYNNSQTRYREIVKIKKVIREYCSEIKEKNYNSDTKMWKDIDVTKNFQYVRKLMINNESPFPHYVWKLIAGDPFERIYRVSRDYMKWKGTIEVAQHVFKNICNWENGEIFKYDEIYSKNEIPLWINWNKIGKDFISLKSKLKKEDGSNLNWLKGEVKKYIEHKVDFYKQFSENSPYYIQNELLQKFNSI